ncbi:MAG TPA: phosphoglycerate kinase [Gammaproteobacteria bacterium]|nr:phosphoglycerate kinase [Gammaproteobacteria bacterium]
MTDVDLSNKRVLIREDFNVPFENGKISSDARLLAALPTIKLAQEKGAKIILISHLGRPEEGKFEADLSLEPVAIRLGELLNTKIKFYKNYLDTPINLNSGEIILCENTRFNMGEKSNNTELAKKLANLCDVFVMDAFATSHRAEASTYGVAQYAPIAVAGPLLVKELDALYTALKNPKRPLIAIVGGSKVSSKLSVLEKLLDQVDGLIVGGGIANTFLAAKNINIGKSLYEKDLIPAAQKLLKTNKIYLPEDVVIAKAFSKDAEFRVVAVGEVKSDEMILDIGPKTASHYAEQLKNSGTIIWNGPVGVFEFPNFSKGTEALAHAIAESNAFSLAGGGDTLSAIELFHVTNKISYISTGGGAFLEFVEGKALPAVTILEQRGKS